MGFKIGLAERRREKLEKELDRLLSVIIRLGVEKVILFGSLSSDDVHKEGDAKGGSYRRYRTWTMPNLTYQEKDLMLPVFWLNNAKKAIYIAKKIINFIKSKSGSEL